MFVIAFSYGGVIFGEDKKYYQPNRTEVVEGSVKIEIPEDPSLQAKGLRAGFQEIHVGVIEKPIFLGKKVFIRDYMSLDTFEMRFLSLVVRNNLIPFNGAKHALSLQGIDDSLVNQNIERV